MTRRKKNPFAPYSRRRIPFLVRVRGIGYATLALVSVPAVIFFMFCANRGPMHTEPLPNWWPVTGLSALYLAWAIYHAVELSTDSDSTAKVTVVTLGVVFLLVAFLPRVLFELGVITA